MILVDVLRSHHADGGFTPPEWVHLVPAGTFYGRDGRGPYVLDADAVLSAFDDAGLDLPIDYEHQSLDAVDKAGPVPAAGWIKELQAREDGLWARVEWTPKAIEMLSAKEYRYLSPVFRHDRSGRIVAVEGAGLTHNPNLHLRAAASKGDRKMDDLMERVCSELNLTANASSVDDVIAEIKQRLADAQASVDAAQAAQADAESRAAHATERLAAIEAEIAVSDAMRAGKIAPAQKDWALAYCRRDPNGFADYLRSAPPIIQAGSAQAKPPVDMTPDEIARAAQAWQAEQAALGVRVSIAQAVAHVKSTRP